MQRILIAGEGGQGVQLIAEILAKAAFLENNKASYIPNFGVEQRGGVSLAFVIINKNQIAYPKFFTSDFIVIMSKRSNDRIKSFLGKDTILLDATKYDFGEIQDKYRNMYVLGRLLKRIKIVSCQTVLSVLEEKIASKIKKNPEIKENNKVALEKGYNDEYE